jgi:hypothetical protein
METTTIYKDGVQVAQFTGEDSENKAFGWLLRNQGQSTDWALRYGGYSVEVDSDGVKASWKPYDRINRR